VVIASGREGGAHCSWRDTSTMVLVPEVVQCVSRPVVAAGGSATAARWWRRSPWAPSASRWGRA